MELKCLHCECGFDGAIELDELGWHSSCPECGCSFDVDMDEDNVSNMKVKLNHLGNKLYDVWWRNYCRENDSLGGNSAKGDFVEGWCIIDNYDYIKTIEDECGLLLFAYDEDVFYVLDEWAKDYAETEKICGGFTIQEVKRELLKYVELA